jgi:hypothetical protein
MIISEENFCDEIEQLHAHGKLTMFDSIFAICEKYKIDYECVGTIVNRSIQEKLKEEAFDKKLMKRESIPLF